MNDVGTNALNERGQSNTELSGFLECSNKYDWKMIHTISAFAEPSGIVSNDAFEYVLGSVISAIDEMKSNINGVLIALHGAMVTELFEDGDGEILKRIRNLVGAHIPIACTLDLHANVTQKMCDSANILISYRTYPHIDMKETGMRAGDILQQAMSNVIHPTSYLIRIPMLEECNSGRTDIGPMIDRLHNIDIYEKAHPLTHDSNGVLAISVNAGFPTDITELGPTVVVCYDDNIKEKYGGGESSDGDKIHKRFASQIANDIWRCRYDMINQFMSVESVLEVARNYPATPTSLLSTSAKQGPLIIADYSDNPG